jgi:hypothetical protein
MTHNMFREFEALYNFNQVLLSGDGLERTQQNSSLNQPDHRNTFQKDPEGYLQKDQLIGLFKNL